MVGSMSGAYRPRHRPPARWFPLSQGREAPRTTGRFLGLVPRPTPDMETIRNWLLPVLLAALQAAWLWPGAILMGHQMPDPVALVGVLAAVTVETVALGRRRRAPVQALVWTLGASTRHAARSGTPSAGPVRRSGRRCHAPCMSDEPTSCHVTGAAGRQGGAVARALLPADGRCTRWFVTRAGPRRSLSVCL